MNASFNNSFSSLYRTPFENNEQLPPASAEKVIKRLRTGTALSYSVSKRQVSSVSDRYQERHELEKQALECRSGLKQHIESEELIRHLLINKVMSLIWIKEHSNPEMLAKVLSPELLMNNGPYFDWVSDLPFTEDQYLDFSSHGISVLEFLPEGLISDDLFIACLKKNPEELVSISRTNLNVTDPRIVSIINSLKKQNSHIVFDNCPELQFSTGFLVDMVIEFPRKLKKIPATRPDYTKILEAVLKKNASAMEFVPVEHLSDELVDIAVSAQPAVDLCFIPPVFLTRERCETVIRNGNKNSLLTPFCDQNFKKIPFVFFVDYPELADLAIDCRYWTMAMPDSIITEERIARHLANFPSYIHGVPQTILENNRQWCEKAVRSSWVVMEQVPEKHKDYEFCLEAVHQQGYAIQYIPESLQIRHPDLTEIAVKNGGLYYLSETMKTEKLCLMAVNSDPSQLHYVPQYLWEKMPLWVLACEAPEILPQSCWQHLLESQDTCYLPDLPSAKLSVDRDALLESLPPYQPEAPHFFAELKKQMLACKPFQLKNSSTGDQLQNYIAMFHDRVASNIKTGNLPRPGILTDNAEVYGGRALLCENPLTGKCERYKFLRKGESLENFTREGAVHSFCYNTVPGLQLKSQLHSEVPMPVDYHLIPKKVMRDKYIQACKSELETVFVDGEAYYVGYQFLTSGKDYSTLAHQAGIEGNAEPAERGILKAAHDLGVWSSCGAVHTSTIKAYHQFESNRKELFLVSLFTPQYFFPGCIRHWNTKATDESDWGWTGLRDIGDMAFYPFIDDYTSAKNADFVIPGYGQRCSFLEGFVSNMVAAVLHYARLHQGDQDYHYSQSRSVERMAQFIESVINSYLSGLLGSTVQARDFFESNEVYSQWLRKSALETLYWTAPQASDLDCISAHLAQGICASSVYPDKMHRLVYMAEKFRYENLGLCNSRFGLTWLVRGLGLLSGGIAERLQPF